jgi:hypothetical protein
MLALAAIALAVAPTTADYITPDSILRPPLATYAGVAGTSVDEGDYVTTQYAGLGIIFPMRVLTPQVTYATAVASVEGVNVWAPVLRSDFGGGVSSVLAMDAIGNVTGTFAKPTASVTVDLVWQGNATGSPAAFRADGSSLFTSVEGGTGTHRLTLEGGELVSFGVGGFPDLGPPGDPPFAWGVAAVQFPGGPVQTAPEPGAFSGEDSEWEKRCPCLFAGVTWASVH